MRSKSQRPGSEMRLYFREPNVVGGTWHSGRKQGGRREPEAKRRSSGVWQTCILEPRLTRSMERVFHASCFCSNSPGASEYSFHRPETPHLKKRGLNSTTQREESSRFLHFQPVRHPFATLSFIRVRSLDQQCIPQDAGPLILPLLVLSIPLLLGSTPNLH